MRRTRACGGPGLTILSGDDEKTSDMMADPEIGAAGVISVVSNVCPGPVQQMVHALREGDTERAQSLREGLTPLFNIVTVKTEETTPHGPTVCKARNPLAIKTLMNILGMHVGPCRPPLGKMTARGLDVVLDAARAVWKDNPEFLMPVGEAYKVDIEERLYDERFTRGLTYKGDPYS
jgi:4-hydroxy-tetrahydrodipicolinate synthase